MISIILCVASFVFAFIAGRRSLVAGLMAVLTVGYFYGITRANVPETFSHFIFDAAVLGLYCTQLLPSLHHVHHAGFKTLKSWVGLLILWPCLLFLVPVQDYSVQLVGLRGNIFLLPFVLMGARLESRDVYKLAMCFAVLNLVAFAFAVAEYVIGVEPFYPVNEVTELIYRSVVDENYANPNRSTALRIPAIFTGAHSFGGTMTLTCTFLLGAWVQRQDRPRWHNFLLLAAMIASILGVFMAAARTPVIFLFVMFAVFIFSGRMKAQTWLLLLLMLAGVGWAVTKEERLQRFTTLQDTNYVGNRLYGSVNDNFLELIAEYPMGNGLGGGGTSIPYFLQGRLVPPTFFMENEYARIVLEQGVIGLYLWIAFIIWVFTRRGLSKDAWYLGRRLARTVCALHFATCFIGTGLLTWIPGTCLLLLSIGWIAVRQPARSENPGVVTPPPLRTEGVARNLARHYG